MALSSFAISEETSEMARRVAAQMLQEESHEIFHEEDIFSEDEYSDYSLKDSVSCKSELGMLKDSYKHVENQLDFDFSLLEDEFYHLTTAAKQQLDYLLSSARKRVAREHQQETDDDDHLTSVSEQDESLLSGVLMYNPEPVRKIRECLHELASAVHLHDAVGVEFDESSDTLRCHAGQSSPVVVHTLEQSGALVDYGGAHLTAAICDVTSGRKQSLYVEDQEDGSYLIHLTSAGAGESQLTVSLWNRPAASRHVSCSARPQSAGPFSRIPKLMRSPKLRSKGLGNTASSMESGVFSCEGTTDSTHRTKKEATKGESKMEVCRNVEDEDQADFSRIELWLKECRVANSVC